MAKKNTHSPAQKALGSFIADVGPLESAEKLFVLVDKRTKASYCECHIEASKLVVVATTDVPLDPNEQADYRANREVVSDHNAFQKMKEDARKGRTFSNIVAEYTKEFDPDHPIKIIGGQHRFEAIREALEAGIDELHGLKVYVLLSKDQRLDVQLISNTNIAVSTDLFDRMQETVAGPQLREWCQSVGFLQAGKDFSDRRGGRGGPISVQLARTFITNYYLGKAVNAKDFATTNTMPILCPSGQHDTDWDELKVNRKTLWTDEGLIEAAREFAALVAAQRKAFAAKKSPRPKPDYPEKAMNPALLAAWAYIAGMLQSNETRRKRHFALRNATGKDPLNAAALTKGRHRTDAENYRGLGYRTDQKERGRFTELFFYQAENGSGITPAAIDVAIKQYHAKQAQLEVIKAKAKGE